MARIRTIKPTFFSSYDVASVTPLARLFYAFLWCESDREGRLEYKPKNWKMRFFPLDNIDIEGLLDELQSSDDPMIISYKVGGDEYIEIPSFSSHQVINNREAESIIPARVKVACTRGTKEGRKEGKGREGKAGDAAPKFTKPAIEEIKAYCRERNRGVNPDKWFNHYSANGWKVGKNPMKDWKAAIRTWEEAPGDEPEKQWHETSAGVILKAGEVGVIPVEGEPIGILKQRVADKLGITL